MGRGFEFIAVLGLALGAVLFAETGPGASEQQAIRQMQMRVEEQRIQSEMANPKAPKLAADRAVVGNRKAPIVLVTYSDFQCPYCSKGWETTEALRKQYGKKIVFMFKHFPLGFHPWAMPAAKRFEAIALQSAQKAYQFHDALFREQAKLSTGGEAFLDGLAKKVKANMKKMKADLDSDKVKARIAHDMEEAKFMGISGTPGFNVAGVVFKGAYPLEMFQTVIDARLKEGKREVAAKKEPKPKPVAEPKAETPKTPEDPATQSSP